MSNSNANHYYTEWTSFEPGSVTITDTIGAALGEYASDYDVPAIEDDIRAAINATLPDGVTIHGPDGNVVGPYETRDQDIDYRGIWEGVDFWAIATKHERSARYEARTYLLDTVEGDSLIDAEAIPAEHASLTPELSAADLGCAPGTRYRVDMIAIDADGTETLIRSTEVAAD